MRIQIATCLVPALLLCAACNHTPGGTADGGTSSAPKCASSGKNAFDTYGAAAFVKVNESIFTNVGAESTAHGTANLGDSFTKIGTNNPVATKDDAPTFKGKLAAFLVFAYGGPTSITYTDGKTYQGAQDMTVAHTGLNINSAQYDYFVSNIVVPALTANGVTQADVTSCFAPVVTNADFKKTIVQSSTPTGPGAKLACAGGKDAWDTFGVAAFVAVNESIFTNVGSESTAHGTTNLGDSFTKIGSNNPPSTKDNAATFKGNLAAFLVYAFGGPASITYTDSKTYAGPQDMVQAHTGLNITSSQYDYFVSMIVVPALTTNGVTSADVTNCFAPVVTDAAFKASIVGK